MNHKLFLSILLIVTFFIYMSSLKGQLVWDDASFIKGWSAIQPKSLNIPALISGDLPPLQGGVYRPLRSLLYAFNRSLYSDYLPLYHLQAIITHLLTILIVYYLTLEITKNKQSSLIASTIFALHPLAVEAISWQTASYDTIGNLFYFLTLLLYMRKKYLLSILICFISIFWGEINLTLPITLFLIEIIINKSKNIKQTIPSFLILISYTLIRLTLHLPARAPAVLGSYLNSLLIGLVSLLKYVRLLMFPFPLLNDQPLVPGISALFHFNLDRLNPPPIPNTLYIYALLSLSIILGITFLVIKNYKKHPVISFALISLLISFLPVLQIIPQSVLFSERYAYLSLFSFALLLVQFKKPQFLLILVLPYTLVTFNQVKVWQSNLSLWSHSVKYNSASNSYLNLASAYTEADKPESALEAINKSLSLNPNNPLALYNKAVILNDLDHPQEAIQSLETALSLNPHHLDSLSLIGILLNQTQQSDRAVPYLLKAHELAPDSLDILTNLGHTYFILGDYQNAEKYYLLVIDKAPSWEQGKLNLQKLYEKSP